MYKGGNKMIKLNPRIKGKFERMTKLEQEIKDINFKIAELKYKKAKIKKELNM